MEGDSNEAVKPLEGSKTQVPLIQCDNCIHVLECNAKQFHCMLKYISIHVALCILIRQR